MLPNGGSRGAFTPMLGWPREWTEERPLVSRTKKTREEPEVRSRMVAGRLRTQRCTDSDSDIVEPSAAAMAESLRAVGYSVRTAVADLVDNSISAGASSVRIHFEWDGANSWMSLADDGCGMTEAELVAAMKLGSRSPKESREMTDLGRFGLGMKTASFSQARKLTVRTRAGRSAPVARYWDLDVLEQRNAWVLMKGSTRSADAILGGLSLNGSGTVVLWEKMDRLVGVASVNDTDAQAAFHQVIEKVRRHLSMIFHRHLEGSTQGGSAEKIEISVNGLLLVPWDPFLTRSSPSSTPIGGPRPLNPADGSKVQAFILPHYDKFPSEEAKQAAGGPDGWILQQGFYVYRQDRLLVAGGWLSLPKLSSEQLFSLCRIRIDLTNKSDEAWGIDVKKSRARPPRDGLLRDNLLRVAKQARDKARQVFVHRGTYGNRTKKEELLHPWTSTQRNGRTVYKVDRKHPLVEAAISAAGSSAALKLLLQLLEETVPVEKIWLQSSEKPQQLASPHSSANPEDMRSLLARSRALLSSYGLASDVVDDRLRTMEPFSSHAWLFASGVNDGG